MSVCVTQFDLACLIGGGMSHVGCGWHVADRRRCNGERDLKPKCCCGQLESKVHGPAAGRSPPCTGPAAGRSHTAYQSYGWPESKLYGPLGRPESIFYRPGGRPELTLPARRPAGVQRAQAQWPAGVEPKGRLGRFQKPPVTGPQLAGGGGRRRPAAGGGMLWVSAFDRPVVGKRGRGDSCRSVHAI